MRDTEGNSSPEDRITVKGWVHRVDDDGVTIRDGEGLVTVEGSDLRAPPRESVVSVEGTIRESDADEPTIVGESLEVLSAASSSLPLDPRDSRTYDRDVRLDNRHLDIRNPRTRAIFDLREAVENALHDELQSKGAHEVDLPALVPSVTEGKKSLFKVSYFDDELRLIGHHSNQYKQMLIGSGFERIYSISKIFGYEEGGAINPRCVSEATAVQVDCAFLDYHEFMTLVEDLLGSVHEQVREDCREQLDTIGVELPEVGSFERLTYERSLELVNEELDDPLEWGDDLSNEAEKILGRQIDDYYFIYDWPAEVRDFYVQTKDGGEIAKSFDLMHPRMELMSGAQREYRAEYIEEAVRSEPNLDSESLSFYVDAFEHGIPPHSGGGMGLGRFLMTLLELDDIREVVMFPRDLHRVAP